MKTDGIRAAINRGSLVWLMAPVLVAGLCMAAIAMRVYALGRLPGINGDEAWTGVQAQLWAAGSVKEW